MISLHLNISYFDVLRAQLAFWQLFTAFSLA